MSIKVSGPRGLAIAINEYFSGLGIDGMEMVDVGTHPNDCTGDTFEEAAEKLTRNIERAKAAQRKVAQNATQAIHKEN